MHNRTTVDGSTADAITFNNTYSTAGKITVNAQKKLDGRDLVANEFSFELYDKDGKLVETVKNATDGKVAFTAIDVDKAGEYIYTVKEVKGNAEGITYDETVYTVTATVTDNGDGTLKVVYAYKDQDSKAADGIVFENKYTPAPAPQPPAEPTPEPKDPPAEDPPEQPAEPNPEPQPEPTPTPTPQPGSPKTGDVSNPFLWFAVLFISGGVTFAAGRKVRRLNK